MNNWCKKKIKDFAFTASGGTPSTERMEYWHDGTIPWINSGELSKNDVIKKPTTYITQEALDNSSAKLFPIGTVVIALTGATTGMSAILEIETTTNQSITGIFPSKEHDSKFLLYTLQYNIDKILLHNVGSAQPHINKEIVDNLEFNYPSVSVQNKIARILSTCDAVIEKTQAAIAKYKAIKQGMLHDLFTRGIDLNTNKLRPRYQDAPHLYKPARLSGGESKLGMIPREWEVERLGELCSMKSGDGITSENIYELGDFPVYGGNGLRGYSSKFTHDGEYTLIGRQGALCGNITRVTGKFYASEHAIVVTPENSVELDWLSQKLYSMNLNQYSEATAQPGLSVFKILPLLVEIPPFDEQQKIAERLKAIDNKLQTEQAYLQKMQSIKKGLMEDLLSGRKQVKVSESEFAEFKD